MDNAAAAVSSIARVLGNSKFDRVRRPGSVDF